MPYRRNNYDFVIDSNFNPFTFEELVRPLAIYKEAFDKNKEEYQALADSGQEFSYIGDSLPEGSKAKQIYDNYINDLRTQSQDFSQHGLSINNSRNLINLRNRYRGEIGKLLDINKKREEQIKAQDELLSRDPTMLFSRRADETDFDRYLENPNLGYEKYSGAMLAKQVSDMASNLAKELMDYGQGKKLDAFTNTFIKEYGVSSADVLRAIQHPEEPGSHRALNAIIDSAIKSSNIPQWADVNTLRRAYDYATEGLWSAIGQNQVTQFENFGTRLAAKERSAASSKAKTGNDTSGGMFNIKPMFIYSSKEIKNGDTSRKDGVRSTEFDFPIVPEQQDDTKQSIMTAARGTGALFEVDFDRESNTFKETGKKLSLKDLNDKKYIVDSTRFSPYGATVLITDGNGDTKRYRLPKEIDPTNESNRDMAMSNAAKIQNAISEIVNTGGYYTDGNGNRKQITEEGLQALKQKYDEEVQRAYLYHSNITTRYKVKNQEFNPYAY